MPPATRRAPVAVRAATVGDYGHVTDILACAFVADPVMRHLFPNDTRRPAKLRQFFDLVRRTVTDPADTLIAADDDGTGAAVTVWRKPGEWRIPVSAMLRQALPMIATFGFALPRALRVQSQLEAHHPAAPHWYLEFAGCVPERHGRGLGGAAIRARLAQTDALRLPTALETANEGNLAIYGALGYRVTGDFAVTPDLRFWSMWRDPA